MGSVTRERRTPRRMMISLFVASALMVGIVSSSAGATTGKITVTTPGGTATSATNFAPATATKHRRSVTLNLCLHDLGILGKSCDYGNQFWGPFLTASGRVRVRDGFNACRSRVTVRIQRLKNGSWKTVGSERGTAQTSGKGKYVMSLGPDRTGKYRVIANKKVLNGGEDICVAYRSAPVAHDHTF